MIEESSPAWAHAGIAAPPAASEPSWVGNGMVSELDGESEEDIAREPPSRSKRMILPLVIVGVLVVAIGVVWVLRPDLLRQIVGEIVATDTMGSSEAYHQGREYFLLDTAEGFAQADRVYHRAGAADGLAQAGLAEIYTTWAQHFLDDVADSRLRATKADEVKAPVYTARAELQQESFGRKVEQARRFVEGALKNAPELPETQRAAADYYRLTGDLDKAHLHIAKALESASAKSEARPETVFIQILIDLARTGDERAAIRRLEQVVADNEKLVRCHYRLARLLAVTGEKARAGQSADRVLDLSKQHEGAVLLKQTLSKNQLVAIAAGPAELQLLAAVPDPEQPTEPDAGAASAQAEPDAGLRPSSETTSPTEPEPGEVAVGGAPQSFDALLQRAAELQQRGAREACNLFRQADRMRGGHPEVLVGLGYCAIDSRSLGEAMSRFRQAGERYGPAVIGMAEASQAMGSSRQAIRYYRLYLEQFPSGTSAAMARRNAERLEQQLGEPADGEPSDSGGGTSAPSEPTPITSPPTVITPDEAAPGAASPGGPVTIRVTEDVTPPPSRSDSLATESEPRLRPGEDLN